MKICMRFGVGRQAMILLENGAPAQCPLDGNTIDGVEECPTHVLPLSRNVLILGGCSMGAANMTLHPSEPIAPQDTV